MSRRIYPVNTSNATAICLTLLSLVAGTNANAAPELVTAEDFSIAVADINTELDQTAQRLASALGDSAVRAHVRDQAGLSNLRENILESEPFLATAKNDPKLKSQRTTLGQAEGAVKRIKAKLAPLMKGEIKPGVDIYFPVAAHREGWDGSDDLLVASVPIGDDMSLPYIKAYSVKNGAVYYLDPKQAPTTPTLVIAAEEHRDHAKPSAAPSLQSDHGDHTGSATVDSTVGTQNHLLCDDTDGICFVGALHLKLTADLEGWALGDPEVYLVFGHARSETSADMYRIILDRVKGLNSWHGWTDTAVSPMYFSYKESYGDETYWRFREEDVGINYSLEVNLQYKAATVKATVTVGNFDDDYGYKYILKNELSYNGWYTRSVGGADFCLDKDRDEDLNI